MASRTTPQAVNSSTFHPAPLNHDLSIPELYKYHALNSPTHPAFMYSDVEEGNTTFITYHEAWLGIRKAAAIVSHHLSKPQATAPNRPAVIAVMAASDTLSYIYLLIGIMSLGHTGFPMYPRNSAEATAELLKKTGASHIFTNPDGPSYSLAKDAAVLLDKDRLKLHIFPMVQYEELMKRQEIEGEELPRVHAEDVVLILHSSGFYSVIIVCLYRFIPPAGTTAFPKPIKITKKGLINLSNIPYYGEVDLASKRIAAHTNPAFHAMGSGTYIWPPTSGAIFAVYNPFKPIVPTPANFMASWMADKCDIVFCVPVFLEAWAQDSANVAKLKALDAIIFSGASVNKSIGDMLAESGVVMHPFWGSTEVGPATMFVPRPPPSGQWEYFKLSNHITFFMKPHETLENVFEPIMIPTEKCFPHAFNTLHDEKPAFNVGDLLERHPANPERWRVYGRQDDQIMLSTGEHVNPLPIEDIISQDKHVAAVIVFGTNHFNTGILVQPTSDGNMDDVQLDRFRNLIWPIVEKANSKASAYAQVSKNMIIVTSSSKPLEYTPKGTPRRSAALHIYSAEIDALYNAEEITMSDRQFPDRA
ncbi:acetyl-CoA synthetase-like protein [Mycena metata]|uniref:Acetyl-CoA synthetase-like protein n=1 Tax=Mycena metata TaxID=1033252 RepID=A0AAD7I0X3_9AGAR|nr:acetyl-CoA synthetase-like protein [Mycena metata]